MKKRLSIVLTIMLCVATVLQLAACGCSHKNVITDNAVPATCTQTGLTQGSHCADCGEVLSKQQVVPIKSHNFVVKSGKGATCQSAGLTEGSYCKDCGYVKVEQNVIPKINCIEGSDGYCTMCKSILNPIKILLNYVKKNGDYENNSYSYIVTVSTGVYLSISCDVNGDDMLFMLLSKGDSLDSYVGMFYDPDSDLQKLGMGIEYSSGYTDEGSGYILKSTASSDSVYIYNFSYQPGISSSLKNSAKNLWTSQTKLLLTSIDIILCGIDKNLSLKDFGFTNS